MTIGVLWEFFEFASDKVLSIDMQKDRVVDKISSVELDPEKTRNAIMNATHRISTRRRTVQK